MKILAEASCVHAGREAGPMFGAKSSPTCALDDSLFDKVLLQF